MVPARFFRTNCQQPPALYPNAEIVLECINENADIQPLLWVGKQLSLKDILHHVAIRKLKLVQRIGAPQQLTNIVQQIFENVRWTEYTFSLF